MKLFFPLLILCLPGCCFRERASSAAWNTVCEYDDNTKGWIAKGTGNPVDDMMGYFYAEEDDAFAAINAFDEFRGTKQNMDRKVETFRLRALSLIHFMAEGR